jgi:DNA-binding NarL/FixJ family response regulator
MKKSVLLADDHKAVRELLGRYLEGFPEYKVVGQAGTGLEAILLLRKTKPDLAIIDLVLPELCGHEVIFRVRKELPETRFVVFTGASAGSVLANALWCDPDGLVHKCEPLEVLLTALRVVTAGGRFFSPKVNQYVSHLEWGALKALSRREIEIMQSIAEGKCNKEIGTLLGLATKTVNNHRARLMQKLGVHNAAALTVLAVQMGIVQASGIPASLFSDLPFSQRLRSGRNFHIS